MLRVDLMDDPMTGSGTLQTARMDALMRVWSELDWRLTIVVKRTKICGTTQASRTRFM